MNTNTSPILSLYEVDCTNIVADTYFRFCNEVEIDGSNVTFDGEEYTAFPIEATGFEQSIEGRFPEPEITLANTNGYMSGLIQALGGLRNSKVTRKRIHYSDLASPELQYTPDIYYVNRYTENALAVSFSLKSFLDRGSLQLPRRRLITLITDA